MTYGRLRKLRPLHFILLGLFILSGCGDDDDAVAPPVDTPPTLAADYRFQNTHASSTGTPAALVDLGGPNTFGTATVNGAPRTVLSFAENDGVSLTPTTGVIPNDRYSVVILFSFTDVDSYRRILDPLNATDADLGLYNYSRNLLFYDIGFASGSDTLIVANTFVQVVLTRDSSRRLAGYVDGVRQFSVVDSLDTAVIAADTLNFFRDDFTEASAGSVVRIRLYDDALTASEVSALGQ